MRCFMNYSKQREVILDYVNKCHCHPTANKVYDEVKKVLPKISFSTVYRNLNQLVDLNKIKKISLDGEKYIFDDLEKKHIHFYCNKCECLKDIFIENAINIENIEDEIQSIEVVVKGICKDCKEG